VLLKSDYGYLVKRFLLFCLLAISPAPLALGQSDADCLGCHSDASLSTTRKGKTVSLHVDGQGFSKSAHASLGCVACHEGFNPSELPHAAKIAPVNCLSCHEGNHLDQYAQSVHGKSDAGNKPAASCADCHTQHAIRKISDLDVPHRKEFAKAVCTRCHTNVAERFALSDHSKALAAGVQGAPGCTDCHGEHAVRAGSDTLSKTSRLKIASTCLACHLDNPDVRARVGPSAGFIGSYENSVHGVAIKSGNDAAATCIDCHTGHEVRKASDPQSGVAKKNIASTCAQCHGDIRDQYEQSIHGVSLAKGVNSAPTCTDCHGEHFILSPKDTRSPVSAGNVSTQVCTPCHASVRLTAKFGLASDRFESFEDSYHGLAGRAGSMVVANCASCHGVHDIKPSSDSTSSISPKKLAQTCGKCHPGANENFTRGTVHVLPTSGQDGFLHFVASSYIVLIIVVIGGMFVHNIVDFFRKSARQLAYRRGELQRTHVAHRLYVRMTLQERVQHGVLLVSFISLVLTGFALRYPDAWWVASIRSLSSWMFDLRGIVHRIAAVCLIAAGLYHLYYVLLVPRGKQLVRDLLPRRQDITDAIQVMRYNLGFSKTKPQFGRFSYIEKSEYWALVWGTAVMGLTGFIMWFDNTSLGLITKLWWDVARTVHYYEAWLATLAIIVWHFYFVIFNPDTYPINLAFWKGTLTEEEMEEEHPLELEAIKRKEMEAEHASGEKPGNDAKQ
jgi:cytochrome b subunit of formate dehydrogenase